VLGCGSGSAIRFRRTRASPKDLPPAEQSVVKHLTVRRFICSTDNCPRRTFAQPLAQLTAPYARFTTRLGHVLERVGLALAGRAGARLTAQLGFQVGRMTLLRRATIRGWLTGRAVVAASLWEASTADGARISQWAATGGTHQRFRHHATPSLLGDIRIPLVGWHRRASGRRRERRRSLCPLRAPATGGQQRDRPRSSWTGG
jgi:hypothetical protein